MRETMWRAVLCSRRWSAIRAGFALPRDAGSERRSLGRHRPVGRNPRPSPSTSTPAEGRVHPELHPTARWSAGQPIAVVVTPENEVARCAVFARVERHQGTFRATARCRPRGRRSDAKPASTRTFTAPHAATSGSPSPSWSRGKRCGALCRVREGGVPFGQVSRYRAMPAWRPALRRARPLWKSVTPENEVARCAVFARVECHRGWFRATARCRSGDRRSDAKAASIRSSTAPHAGALGTLTPGWSWC